MNPSNEDLLPDDEGSRAIIAFHEYPGGPPITFEERYVSDDFETDVVARHPYVPGWSISQHPSIPGHVIIGSRRANVLISRELAVAARRQLYLRYRQLGIELAWHSMIPQHKAFLAGQEREWPPPKLLQGSSSEAAGGAVRNQEVRRLEDKVKFLEAELRSDRSYLQLYRLGASGLLLAVVSLMVWAATGSGVPFHPIFAACVIPASLGVMAMAFLMRPDNKPKK